MEIQSAANIIARMREDYASTRSSGGVDAKERYSQQAAALTAYAEEHHGIAISAREIDYGPAVKFPLTDIGPSPTDSDASPNEVSQAYAEGAAIATTPEYGSVRLLKLAPASAAQHTLISPEKEDDATLISAADALARDLQKAKDQEAVRSDIMAIFNQNGIPENTLYQMEFDQREDGSIAVGNHPLAAEVETLVNADQGLSDMLAFSFGFNSRTNVTA